MSESKGGMHSIQLQDRDLALLRGLFECRIMTIAHAAVIHFDGRREYAKKRIQRLKAAEFVGERPRRMNESSILFLARDGLLLLQEHGLLADYPQFAMSALLRRANVSDRTIKHELAVMDVKAAFHAAVRGGDRLSIAEFGTWPRLYEFEARHPVRGRMVVKPDGFLRIREKKDGGIIEHAFFLEVDRSTETLDTIASKASGYLDYYRSGAFALKNGASREDYPLYPFRVLIVCISPERRDSIARRLLQCRPPILTQVLISTLAEVICDPFGGIWRRPGDYTKMPNVRICLCHSASRLGLQSEDQRQCTPAITGVCYTRNKLE